MQLKIVKVLDLILEENRLLLNELGLNEKIIELLGSNDYSLSSGSAIILASMVEEDRIFSQLNKPENQELLGKVLRSDNQLSNRAALLLANAYIIKGNRDKFKYKQNL